MSRLRIVGSLLGLFVFASLGGQPALAAGPGLPRTYDVQRIDSPNPGTSRTFALTFTNGGDLNGDGKEDLLASQGTAVLNDGFGADDGELYVISGADGSLIRTISAPEPDPVGSADDRKPAFGTYVGKLADLGSCPGGDGADADQICDAGSIGPGDGIPEILASAAYVDVPTPGGGGTDIGRVYVIDGGTGAVLKRIDMPEADRIDQSARTEQLGSLPARPVRPLFGRTVLSPSGLPPCRGNAGIGACPGLLSVSKAVRNGDLDGGGQPDIVVGASFVQDDESTNPACDDTAANDVCDRSGRLYMYRGEEIAGSDPASIESTPNWNVKDPVAQSDPANPTVVTEPELFGHSVAPIGDVGRCTGPGVTPGAQCPSTQIGGPDRKPEVLVSAPRADYPLNNPTPERFDVGTVLLLDGATGAVLHRYLHPDPQASAIFGFTIYNQPAPGNLGDTGLPDVYLPAIGQDLQFGGQGQGYVLNGNRVSPDAITLARLNDPTPQASGGFGTSSAGVGDLAGDARNELLVGELASHGQNPNAIGAVHIFDPLTEQALQTITDPDQQKVSDFGASLAPLGDLNGDGFLDLAVGAGSYDTAPGQQDAGRLYVFRSNNTPPPAEAQPEEAISEGDFTDFGDIGLFDEEFTEFDTGAFLASRTIKLRATRKRVTIGRKSSRRSTTVQLKGSVSAPENQETCEPSQEVQLERRKRTGPRRLRRYKSFQPATTGLSGRFKSKKFRPRRSYDYRAVLAETEECLGATSNQVRITVRVKSGREKRTPEKK